MKNIVFLPGLGADERMFQFIELEICTKQFIKWIKPAVNETLHSYLLKIKEQVTTGDPVVLIGVSLGGIMAMELREFIPVEKTILISSVKTRGEMPPYFEWIGKIGINEIIPSSLLKISAPIIKPFITDTSNEKAMELFKLMLQDTDDDFMKMAIKFVLQWQRMDYKKENLIHIHGTKDIVFPLRNISNCDYKIKGGTHDMIMSSPQEINKILMKEVFSKESTGHVVA